ncbi:MAG: tetratricopeptide repeat protein, partial [Cyanothece sp. SIO2G6]|nr:tetratricopeptide repeat protein [Cyanothece sp. SIO2G6]
MRSFPKRFKSYIFISLLVLTVSLSLWFGQASPAATGHSQPRRSVVALVNQGVERYQRGDFQGAIASWQTALSLYHGTNNRGTNNRETSTLLTQAILLENLARTYGELGNPDRALFYWQQSLRIQQQLSDRVKVGRLLTEQAQTHMALGQYGQALEKLCGSGMSDGLGHDGLGHDGLGHDGEERDGAERDGGETCGDDSAVGIAMVVGDHLGEAAALGSLGEVLRLQGFYPAAEQTLRRGMAIATELNQVAYQVAANRGLGTIYQQRSQISDRRARDAEARGDLSDVEKLTQQAGEYNAAALIFLETSLEAARQTGDPQAQLQTLTLLVRTYHRAGDTIALAQA